MREIERGWLRLKNEAIVRLLLCLLGFAAFLQFTELRQGSFELTAEALAVHAQSGDRPYLNFGTGGQREDVGFEHHDTVEAPSRVDQ